MNKTQIDHQLYLLNQYPFRGKTFTKGEGAYLVDDQGEKYLDFMTNYGVNIFGYNHPVITKTLKNQIQNLSALHGSFANEVRSKVAKDLVRRCGGKLRKVYFSNSGAEAVEAAIKFAVLASGRSKIIAAKGSYHGKTFAALSVTHNKKYKLGLDKLLIKVSFVPYGDLMALDDLINKRTAAVILEPIQGESGIIIPPKGYLKAVEDICTKNGSILILDEIQTGLGRTGKFLASEKDGVEADVVCLGKGLAGGIPVGATLVSKSIADKIPKLVQTSTFGGNPLACSGIIATLGLLDKEMLDHVEEMGKRFLSGLLTARSKSIKEVRGAGLMIGVKVAENRNDTLKKLQQDRILAAPAGDNVIRFLPPYIVTKKELNKVVFVLTKILT